MEVTENQYSGSPRLPALQSTERCHFMADHHQPWRTLYKTFRLGLGRRNLFLCNPCIGDSSRSMLTKQSHSTQKPGTSAPSSNTHIPKLTNNTHDVQEDGIPRIFRKQASIMEGHLMSLMACCNGEGMCEGSYICRSNVTATVINYALDMSGGGY